MKRPKPRNKSVTMTALKESRDDTGRAKLPHHRKSYSVRALTGFIGSSMRADKEKLIFRRHQFFTQVRVDAVLIAFLNF